MHTSDERPTEVLAFTCRPESIDPLRAALAAGGSGLDVAIDIEDLRRAFLHRGGHRLLLLGPDLPPRLAIAAARSLRAVDPDLAVVAFGDELCRQALPSGTTKLPEFHLGSRAGVGAILRVLACGRAGPG